MIRAVAASALASVALLGVAAPSASADVRAGVVIEYSGVSDFSYMLVDPTGGSHNDAIKLHLGDTYKVPSSRTSTLVVQIVGESWKQRWDGGGYGGCHGTGDDFASSWFEPNHDILKTVRFLSYTGDQSCHHS